MTDAPPRPDHDDAADSVSPGDPRPAKLSFSAGGWVIVLAILFSIGIFLVTLLPALQRNATRPPGDGTTVASYQFSLDGDAAAGRIVPAHLHRDMTMPLVAPPVMRPEDVDAWNEENRGKYLVSTDPVVGIVIDGTARAYPLTVIGFHEVVNDVVGGVPILINFNPMPRTLAVYDRRVDGTTLEFGNSGLMLDSAMLLYERWGATATATANTTPPATAAAGSGGDAGAVAGDDAGAEAATPARDTATPELGGEALWHPATGAALTGASHEAGRSLARIPFTVTQWAVWRSKHPDTTVLEWDDTLEERYETTAYTRYWAHDTFLYPVDGLDRLPDVGLRPKDGCVVLEGAGPGGTALVVPETWIAAQARRVVLDATALDPAEDGSSADGAGALAPPSAGGEPILLEDGTVLVPPPVEGRRPPAPPSILDLETAIGPLRFVRRTDPETIDVRRADGQPIAHVRTAWYMMLQWPDGSWAWPSGFEPQPTGDAALAGEDAGGS